MAYFDSMNKKPMSRQDHLRKDAKAWDKEDRRAQKKNSILPSGQSLSLPFHFPAALPKCLNTGFVIQFLSSRQTNLV